MSNDALFRLRVHDISLVTQELAQLFLKVDFKHTLLAPLSHQQIWIMFPKKLIFIMHLRRDSDR